MGGVLGWRRSCGRGQESEQEQTWEQERGLRATCDCGRDCDCDWDCHYGCDCACNRYRVRSTDGTRTLLVGSSGTRPSITVHGLACRGVQSSAAICARGPLGSRGSRSRGQDLEQERTREQAQGGVQWPPATVAVTATAAATVTTTATATAIAAVSAVRTLREVCRAALALTPSILVHDRAC